MIAEALNVLFKTAQQAAGAENQAMVIELPGVPGKVAVVNASGVLTFHDKLPPKRAHALGSIAEVKGFVDFAKDQLEGTPSVWYDEDGIVVVVQDDADSQRIDTAKVAFEPTQTHEVLREIGEKWFRQKDFVRLLRVTLADAATDSTRHLLAVSRVLGFSNSTAGHAKVEHGRQSLGRDIEDQVTSEVGDLPDEVTFSVRLFTDPVLSRRFPIRCAVDIDPAAATFNLAPLAEAFEDAVDEQLALLGEQLHGELECPVFRGRP